jgi:hypothetical protein
MRMRIINRAVIMIAMITTATMEMIATMMMTKKMSLRGNPLLEARQAVRNQVEMRKMIRKMLKHQERK